ncbi:MAG: UbiA family prenyltransferase [Thermodesulfobacteriota bacterium]
MAFGQQLKTAARAVRVTGWVHFLGLFLLGWAWAGAGHPGAAALGLAASALYLSFTFGVNNLYDRGLDPASKNPFAAGGLSPRAGAVAMAFLAGAGLVFAFAASPGMGAVFVFMTAASFAYSGPWRMKRFPFWGSFHNALIFGPLFLAGCLAVRPLALADLAWTVLFSFTVLIVQVAQELSDRAGDAAAGLSGTAIVLGTEGSLLLIMALSVSRYLFSAALLHWGMAGWGGVLICFAVSLAETGWTSLFYYEVQKGFSKMRLGLRFINMGFGIAMLGLFLQRL